MASVYLLSSAPPNDPARPHPYDELGRMREAAANDKFGAHELTASPEDADIILFVENTDTIYHYFHEARDHPLYRQHQEKCFLFSKTDHPIAFLPGIYPSIQKRWYAPQRTRSGHYLRTFAKDYLELDTSPAPRDFLYSFIGSSETHPLRKEIFDLQHEEQYLHDTSSMWPYAQLEGAERDKFEQRYTDVIQRSYFVLCPRGRGASSHRLFETMRMGRVPVIISDEWVPPKGPPWHDFSVRIPEDDIQRIPDLLAEKKDEAPALGQKARSIWEDWFSQEATFHRTVEWCLDILHSRRRPERIF